MWERKQPQRSTSPHQRLQTVKYPVYQVFGAPRAEIIYILKVQLYRVSHAHREDTNGTDFRIPVIRVFPDGDRCLGSWTQAMT